MRPRCFGANWRQIVLYADECAPEVSVVVERVSELGNRNVSKNESTNIDYLRRIMMWEWSLPLFTHFVAYSAGSLGPVGVYIEEKYAEKISVVKIMYLRPYVDKTIVGHRSENTTKFWMCPSHSRSTEIRFSTKESSILPCHWSSLHGKLLRKKSIRPWESNTFKESFTEKEPDCLHVSSSCRS